MDSKQKKRSIAVAKNKVHIWHATMLSFFPSIISFSFLLSSLPFFSVLFILFFFFPEVVFSSFKRPVPWEHSTPPPPQTHTLESWRGADARHLPGGRVLPPWAACALHCCAAGAVYYRLAITLSGMCSSPNISNGPLNGNRFADSHFRLAVQTTRWWHLHNA